MKMPAVVRQGEVGGISLFETLFAVSDVFVQFFILEFLTNNLQSMYQQNYKNLCIF